MKNEEYTEAGVPLIQLNNISECGHVLNDVKFVSEAKADSLAKHNALPGDIVIAKMADPVARAAIVRSDFQRYVIVADCIRGLKSNGTETYAKAPYFQMASDSLSIL